MHAYVKMFSVAIVTHESVILLSPFGGRLIREPTRLGKTKVVITRFHLVNRCMKGGSRYAWLIITPAHLAMFMNELTTFYYKNSQSRIIPVVLMSFSWEIRNNMKP